MGINKFHIVAIFCFIISGIFYLIGHVFSVIFIIAGIVFEISAWVLIFSGKELNDKKTDD